jgi:hypothetical protein
MGLEALLPILVKYVLIPEIGKVFAANPGITNEEAMAKLPADIRALAGENQGFLNSIRVEAGRG